MKQEKQRGAAWLAWSQWGINALPMAFGCGAKRDRHAYYVHACATGSTTQCGVPSVLRNYKQETHIIAKVKRSALNTPYFMAVSGRLRWQRLKTTKVLWMTVPPASHGDRGG